MGTYLARTDEYIANAAPFAQPVLTHLRELIHSVCPDVVETWKWKFPNFDYCGSTMLSMAAFKQHCSFSFWKASLMADPEQILEISERQAMGQFGKITSLKDLPKDSVIKKYIKEAMKLNEDGIKKNTTGKASNEQKNALATPPDFQLLLKKNKQADTVFTEFSYSAKKEYIVWIEEAKTDATRAKRKEQAIEWIAEGKTRHWKYKK
jgi:uncharacterized protein YdeI (YjbR/CyaY-like superfamily)